MTPHPSHLEHEVHGELNDIFPLHVLGAKYMQISHGKIKIKYLNQILFYLLNTDF